jgi:hypothetical protein
VLWRTLVAQAHVYRALMVAFDASATLRPQLVVEFPAAERPRFDWWTGTPPDDADDPVPAASEWLAERLGRLLFVGDDSPTA